LNRLEANGRNLRNPLADRVGSDPDDRNLTKPLSGRVVS
jgi:hypothetical protein